MKRIITIFSIATAGIIMAALLFNVSMEVRAIKGVKVEIYDVHVEHLLPDIVLTVGTKIINDEHRKVRGLSGNFTILVSNTSVGIMGFDAIDIGATSYETVRVMLTISYSQVAQSLIEAITAMQFTVAITGSVTGKIFFGLMNYEQPVEARWQA